MRNHKSYKIKSLQVNKLKPKSGKSTLMASLDDNLIIDLEDGYRALSVMAVVAKTSQQLFEVKDALRDKMGSPDNKVPYKYITIDNATRLEEMALNYAAQLLIKQQPYIVICIENSLNCWEVLIQDNQQPNYKNCM